MFRYDTELNLRSTDAAGVAFFASYYAIAHDAYEAYLRSEGRPLSLWLDEVCLPIVHSEADYTAPLTLDQPFTVLVRCEKIGHRSFTLSYEFVKDVKVFARLQTVHVAVSIKTESAQSTSLPSELRTVLERLIDERGADPLS